MQPNKKKRNPLVIAVIVLLALALLLCGVVAGLWLNGRSSLAQSGEGPTLPPQQLQTGAQSSGDAAQSGAGAEEDGSFVEYNGLRYRYNESMVNILLMGVDSYHLPEESQGERDQVDVFVLAALNMDEHKMTLISLPRDIMCDVEVRGEDGSQEGLMHMQLAMAYAYGDGQHGSCELARDTVSNIFYGLPIQGYAAYYLSGIEELNDAVGGVTVKVIADVDFSEYDGCKDLVEGAEVTLNGKQARTYIQARLKTQLDANDLRMSRQKQYMLSLISRAKEMVLANPASVIDMYGAVEDYVLTDLGLGEIAYLATKAANMDFSQDIHKVTGELLYNAQDKFVELYVDQQALYDLMLEVFYTPVD